MMNMMDMMDTVSPRAWNPYGIHGIWLTMYHPAAIFKAPTTGCFHPGGFHQPWRSHWSQASDASLRSSGTTATSPCWASTKGDEKGEGMEGGGAIGPGAGKSSGVSKAWFIIRGYRKMSGWQLKLQLFECHDLIEILSRASTNPVTILMNSEIGKNQKLDKVLNNSNFYKFLCSRLINEFWDPFKPGKVTRSSTKCPFNMILRFCAGEALPWVEGANIRNKVRERFRGNMIIG